MLPPVTDPRWVTIIKYIKDYSFNHLPTRLLMMRIHLMTQDGTNQKILEAIESAHDFFTKNAHLVQDDIEMLFKKEEK